MTRAKIPPEEWIQRLIPLLTGQGYADLHWSRHTRSKDHLYLTEEAMMTAGKAMQTCTGHVTPEAKTTCTSLKRLWWLLARLCRPALVTSHQKQRPPAPHWRGYDDCWQGYADLHWSRHTRSKDHLHLTEEAMMTAIGRSKKARVRAF